MNFCKENEIILTNTLFQHKMSHRTTWEAPFRSYQVKDGSIRRNPVRNQIDYAICRIQYRRFVTDTRSYNDMLTNTDHRLVIMKTNFQWRKMKYFKKVQPKLDIQKLTCQENRNEYRRKAEEHNNNSTFNVNPQEQCNKILENCKTAGKEILGTTTI